MLPARSPVEPVPPLPGAFVPALVAGAAPRPGQTATNGSDGAVGTDKFFVEGVGDVMEELVVFCGVIGLSEQCGSPRYKARRIGKEGGVHDVHGRDAGSEMVTHAARQNQAAGSARAVIHPTGHVGVVVREKRLVTIGEYIVQGMITPASPQTG